MSPKGKAAKAPLLEAELAELIQWIRGEKVMLDRDLARLYQVEVKVLNQAVKRNSSRFPADFMFQLTAVEAGYLRSQSVTLDGVEAAASSVQRRGKHLKYNPFPQSKRRIGFAPWDDKAWTGTVRSVTRQLNRPLPGSLPSLSCSDNIET